MELATGPYGGVRAAFLSRPTRGAKVIVANQATIELIEEAVTVLRRHPLIGRSVETGLRELVISRGRSGHVALYSFEQVYDAVLILAIRHQREAGYTSDGDD